MWFMIPKPTQTNRYRVKFPFDHSHNSSRPYVELTTEKTTKSHAHLRVLAAAAAPACRTKYSDPARTNRLNDFVVLQIVDKYAEQSIAGVLQSRHRGNGSDDVELIYCSPIGGRQLQRCTCSTDSKPLPPSLFR